MVNLDSNPTKLIEVVQIGKQMLMTRGSLTTFSIANDVATSRHYSGGVCRGRILQLADAERDAVCIRPHRRSSAPLSSTR